MPCEELVILLAEDNPDHAELVRRSFAQSLTVDIHHVIDGEAALDYLLRRGDYVDPAISPRPHVVLLDLRLPRVDGLQVLREIKKSEDLRRIPVVVLTSSEAEGDMLQAYDAHANSYLVKPLDFGKFTGLMQDLGFYWLGWNRVPPKSS